MYKKLLLLTPFIAGLLFNSCMDDDFGGMNLSPVNLTTQVKFGGDFETTKKAVNASVTLRNADTGVEYVGRTDDEISKIGTNGLLTNGAYTRTDEFMDSILCAISSKYKKID